MGWGQERAIQGPRVSPRSTAAILGLAAATRRFLREPTTGNQEELAQALLRFDLNVRLT